MAQAMRLFAGDAALMTGLQQAGPRAWCSKDSNQQHLEQDLAYLRTSKVMSSTDVDNIEASFALTQASHIVTCLLLYADHHIMLLLVWCVVTYSNLQTKNSQRRLCDMKRCYLLARLALHARPLMTTCCLHNLLQYVYTPK